MISAVKLGLNLFFTQRPKTGARFIFTQKSHKAIETAPSLGGPERAFAAQRQRQFQKADIAHLKFGAG